MVLCTLKQKTPFDAATIMLCAAAARTRSAPIYAKYSLKVKSALYGFAFDFEVALQILKNEIGDVSKIFKQGEIPTSYLSAQNSAKALDASYTDAAQTAQNIQRSDAMIAESVNQALSATTNAQGDMEVQQSLAAMQAANVQATQNGNQLLAQLLATQAQTGYVATYEKAITAQQEEKHEERAGPLGQGCSEGRPCQPQPRAREF